MHNALRQPLLHFFVLGGLVFMLYGWVTSPPDGSRQIVVSAQTIEDLRQRAERAGTVNRARLQGLVREHVDEEILYREALTLGLDQDDVIIRRRLIQKMRFLSEGLARPEPPEEEELRTFYQRHQAQYRQPARLSFTHIYLNPDTRGTRLEADARRLLAELAAAGRERAPERGDRFMLRHDYSDRTAGEVANLFGDAFATALEGLEAGRWHGPVTSAFGWHLVRLSDRRAPRLPAMEEVRERILADYLSQQMERQDARYRVDLRESYRVRIEWPREVLAGAAAGASP